MSPSVFPFLDGGREIWWGVWSETRGSCKEDPWFLQCWGFSSATGLKRLRVYSLAPSPCPPARRARQLSPGSVTCSAAARQSSYYLLVLLVVLHNLTFLLSQQPWSKSSDMFCTPLLFYCLSYGSALLELFSRPLLCSSFHVLWGMVDALSHFQTCQPINQSASSALPQLSPF